ncbi:hypothetical protein [Tamlana crocina]|uniref:Lipoprotein n=1 Tax=Tamlana crocina TaxID=393006 RepID=A0ABX1DEU7_9FLAO|nr:hypothetical protein [Tamlana crocina]NJX16862.1 hypothetical protein [Tamlana crocina]
MKRKLILGIVLMLISIPSLACECKIIPLTNENKDNYQEQYLIEGFKEADFVFYGEVIELIDREIDGYSEIFGWENPNYLKELTQGHFPLFDLKKILKGENLTFTDNRIQIYQDWSNCDMTFKKNQKYVVFGFIDKEGKMRTSICEPNRLINSKKDLRKILKYRN